MNRLRIVFTLLGCLFAAGSCRSMQAASNDTGRITIRHDENASIPVKRACDRLNGYLSAAPSAKGGERTIVVSRLANKAPDLGDEGYLIKTERPATIAVRANTDKGLANGVYALLRTLMIDDFTDPFARTWDVRDKPFFRIRSMMVAPYNFGFAHGFSVLSPDRWAFKHWKEYIDYLRLLNLNCVGIYPMRLYDPEIPETLENKTRYEVWRQAMDYAHELGMEFTFVETGNFVPQELWWQHPELRCENEIAWAGAALCYNKARDLIRRTQRHTFEYFKDADHVLLMFSDGAGACYCDRCSQDQTAVFLRMVDDVKETLRDVGSDADVIFWNWALDFWYTTIAAGLPGYLDRFPQLKEIQNEVFKRLPHDVPFEDVSVVPRIWGGRADTLKRARQEGFKTVINFVYTMNPEASVFMFPQARIHLMRDMARHSKGIQIDGLDGYRLSPATRVLNDFVFMRLAWNPDLTAEQLVDEMAGYLTTKKANRAKVAEAIMALENYWENNDPQTNIDRAAVLFDEAKADEPSRQLEYVADMVSLMPGLYRLSQKGTTAEEANAIKQRMFAQTQKRYILQGFGGTDIQWTPESQAFFNALVGMWAPVHLQAIPLTSGDK